MRSSLRSRTTGRPADAGCAAAVSQNTADNGPLDGTAQSTFDIVRMAITNPGGRGRGGRPAARNSHRRKGARHGQPDHLGPDNQRLQYDVVVEQPISTLEQQLHMLYPGEDVTIGNSDGATILSGKVSSTNVMLRMGEIAAASLPKTS